MNSIKAIKLLSDLDQRLSRYVFNKKDLRIIFSGESENCLNKTIERLVDNGVLERATKGVFIYANARSKNSYIIEEIARIMRQGESKYVSLESALSEYGVISQIPINHITIMTTGRSGFFKTSYGVIEFTHTKRNKLDINKRIISIEGRPLPIATKEAAIEDLRRVGRNLDMLIENKYES